MSLNSSLNQNAQQTGRYPAMRWMQPTADPAGLLEEAAAQGARLSETLDSWQVAPLQGEGPELMEPVEAMTLF